MFQDAQGPLQFQRPAMLVAMGSGMNVHYFLSQESTQPCVCHMSMDAHQRVTPQSKGSPSIADCN